MCDVAIIPNLKNMNPPHPTKSPIEIDEARTDDNIFATFEVMRQLRMHLEPANYVETIRRMMKSDNYRLAALRSEGVVRAVAGFRLMEMLHCDKILYVDDLSTDQATRSLGHGHQLLDWLKQTARDAGCVQLHLDSGVQREDAHRFYFRERLTITAYHFRVLLD